MTLKSAILKILLPGIQLKRWALLIIVGFISLVLFFLIAFGGRIQKIMNIIEAWIGNLFQVAPTAYSPRIMLEIIFLIIAIICLYLGTKHIIINLVNSLLPEKKGKIAHLLFKGSELQKGKKVVVIGGGTGLNSILSGLKKYTNNITAIINVSDEGGSSRMLRTEFGMLPPGDIRNCLVALSDSGPLMAKLLQYRFQKVPGLKGHPMGNLFITAMTKITGDFEKGLEEIEKILAIRGKVLPVSTGKTQLCATLENGKTIEEEPNVEEHKIKYQSEIKKLFLKPAIQVTEKSRQALMRADIIVLGPGSLYTSILPNLLVKGVVHTIKQAKKRKAKVVYVCNVMTQPGETDKYTAADHVEKILQYLGPGMLDYVILNDERAPESLYVKYQKQGAQRVKYDKETLGGFEKQYGVKVVLASLMTKENLLRHDSDKLAKAVLRLV